jgi:phospholipid/cholesterol/gamma-HCH transport system substrate-binding protein
VSPIARRKKTGRRRQLNPLVIAALVIAVTLFIIYYAFHQGLPFVSKYTDYAVVNNSVNVRADSPVRIAGIDIGAVAGTTPDGNLTKIAFSIQDNGLPIHKDATITIRDRLFLEGGYYLQLDPGSPSAPVAPQGWTIPVQNTATPVQFYKILSTFNSSARTDLEQTLNTLNQAFSPTPGAPASDSGAGGLKQAIPQLTPLMKDVSYVSQALTGTHAGDVERLLRTASLLTTTLNDNGSTLNSLIGGLNQSTSALVAQDSDLARTISGVDQTLQVAPAALTAINAALPPLANLARTLTPSLRVSPPLLSTLSTTVAQLSRLITPAKRGPLLTALRTTFTTFPQVLTQLGSIFPVTKSVTDCISNNVVPVLNSQVQDGSLSTGNPVWKDFVHFLPSVAGASGSFDANGHFTRVLAGVGTNSLAGGLTDTLTSTLGAVTKLVGIAPGAGTISGAAPQWIGTLTPADFRPDVSCSTQKVPSLVATPAASDLTSATTPAASQSATTIAADLARAQGKTR